MVSSFLIWHGEHNDGEAQSGNFLLMLHVAIAGEEDLEAGGDSQTKQDSVLDAGPSHLHDGRNVVPPQLVPQRARDILVEQDPHSARKTPRRISSAAITCSRRTDGKWSRNSSRSYPPSR